MATAIFLILAGSGVAFMLHVLFAFLKEDKVWPRLTVAFAQTRVVLATDPHGLALDRACGDEVVFPRRAVEPVVWQSYSTEENKSRIA